MNEREKTTRYYDFAGSIIEANSICNEGKWTIEAVVKLTGATFPIVDANNSELSSEQDAWKRFSGAVKSIGAKEITKE